MPKLLSEKQDWIIGNNTYTLIDEDVKIINNYPITKAGDWKSNYYKPLKDRVRDHYYTIQNGTCCYCRLPINKGTESVQIEHIIDKNKRLDFIFEPKNLVVSCHKCNFNKKTRSVMHICPPNNTYPRNSTDFKIIHGHYDSYFENIEFKQGSIYHAITDEGEFTIKACGLDRIGLAEQREKITMYEDDDIISMVIEIRNSENSNDKIDELINKLKASKNDKRKL